MRQRHLIVTRRASSTSFIIYQYHHSSSVIITFLFPFSFDLLPPAFFRAALSSSFQACDFCVFVAAAGGTRRWLTQIHPWPPRRWQELPAPRLLSNGTDMVFLCLLHLNTLQLEFHLFPAASMQLPSVLPGVYCEWECHCPRLWGDAPWMRKAIGPRVEGEEMLICGMWLYGLFPFSMFLTRKDLI